MGLVNVLEGGHEALGRTVRRLLNNPQEGDFAETVKRRELDDFM
jgi:hypothetical protein